MLIPGWKGRIAHAFDAFQNLDSAGAEAVETWAEQRPDYWVALLVLARHYVSEGWRSRGSAFARDTSQKQIAAMRALFEHADKLLAKLRRATRSSPGPGSCRESATPSRPCHAAQHEASEEDEAAEREGGDSGGVGNAGHVDLPVATVAKVPGSTVAADPHHV